MRSWIAFALVGGLILFLVFSLGLDDSTLRSTSIGALVANTGAAVAFYFASKASDRRVATSWMRACRARSSQT